MTEGENMEKSTGLVCTKHIFSSSRLGVTTTRKYKWSLSTMFENPCPIMSVSFFFLAWSTLQVLTPQIWSGSVWWNDSLSLGSWPYYKSSAAPMSSSYSGFKGYKYPQILIRKKSLSQIVARWTNMSTGDATGEILFNNLEKLLDRWQIIRRNE